jgi:hypothetical protein
MFFEKSNYFKLLKHRKITLSFGDFYLLDNFIIAEFNEGIHFNWTKIQELAAELIRHYGYELKIGFIANRVNSYSTDPHLWTNFNQEFGFFVATAIVVYDDISYMNATLEKQFTENSLKRCSSLEEGIHWMQNLDEFKS